MLAEWYVQKKQDSIDKVQEYLKAAGLTWDAVSAQAMALRMGEFQRLNQMLAKTEARRNLTLKAIERHREGLGEQLRALAEQLEAEKVREGTDQSSTVKLAA